MGLNWDSTLIIDKKPTKNDTLKLIKFFIINKYVIDQLGTSKFNY